MRNSSWDNQYSRARLQSKLTNRLKFFPVRSTGDQQPVPSLKLYYTPDQIFNISVIKIFGIQIENESQKDRKNAETQTFRSTILRNFNLNHPNFVEGSMNSLYIFCKNHFHRNNLVTPKWALFREIYGPSIFLKAKIRRTACLPIHRKIYFKGTSYSTGCVIIPNINLESFICKKWAHCSVIILATNYESSDNQKILIDQNKLELCFYFKIYLSFKLLMSPNDSDNLLNEKINKILNTNYNLKTFYKFLENEGNILSYVSDELSELGLNLKIYRPLNRERENLVSINMETISKFYEPEKSKMFSELISLSCIGSAHTT